MIREKYFSFSGRLNRKPYWLRSLLLFALFIAGGASAGALIGAFGFFASGTLPDLGGPVAIIAVVLAVLAFLVFLAGTVSVAVRRLHDRNKSGWWLLFFYLLPNILSPDSGLYGPADSPLAIVVTLVGLGISIWAFVELGILRGTDGPNRFGPDPLDPDYSDAEVFA